MYEYSILWSWMYCTWEGCFIWLFSCLSIAVSVILHMCKKWLLLFWQQNKFLIIHNITDYISHLTYLVYFILQLQYVIMQTRFLYYKLLNYKLIYLNVHIYSIISVEQLYLYIYKTIVLINLLNYKLICYIILYNIWT